VRGDCELNIALEHYREVGENAFKKSLWMAKATENWNEIILHPGREVLEESSYQVEWNEISHEIGLFSIFMRSGTYLEVDKIVFEGIDFK
jgi:hypothetical protein